MHTVTIYVVSNARETFYTEHRRDARDKYEKMKATPEYDEPLYSEDAYDLDSLNEIQAAELRAVLRAKRSNFSEETRRSIEEAIRRHEEESMRV